MSDSPADRIAALERRLVDLEVRAAFQDRTIDDLDAELRRFSARVEALERELALTRVRPPPAAPGTAEVLAGLDDDDLP